MSLVARRAVTVLAAAALVAAPTITPTASAAGPNLLPNPSFEWTPLEGSITSAGPAHDVLTQPVVPTGWAFEGAAGLFDHTDNDADALGLRRDAYSGDRYVAISIPASGKREQCVDQAGVCVPIPVSTTRPVTDRAATVDPSWRPAAPVSVEAGKTYRMGAYASGELITLGEGAVVKVRWLATGGEAITVATVAQRRVDGADSCAQHIPAPVPQSFCWTPVFGTATAPAGAVAAVLLLQHSEDVNPFGQLMFDDAFFGLN